MPVTRVVAPASRGFRSPDQGARYESSLGNDEKLLNGRCFAASEKVNLRASNPRPCSATCQKCRQRELEDI